MPPTTGPNSSKFAHADGNPFSAVATIEKTLETLVSPLPPPPSNPPPARPITPTNTTRAPPSHPSIFLAPPTSSSSSRSLTQTPPAYLLPVHSPGLPSPFRVNRAEPCVNRAVYPNQPSTPFNKVRTLLGTDAENVYQPLNGTAGDLTRFNPAFWVKIESALTAMMRIGVHAELILFSPSNPSNSYPNGLGCTFEPPSPLPPLPPHPRILHVPLSRLCHVTAPTFIFGCPNAVS